MAMVHRCSRATSNQNRWEHVSLWSPTKITVAITVHTTIPHCSTTAISVSRSVICQPRRRSRDDYQLPFPSRCLLFFSFLKKSSFVARSRRLDRAMDSAAQPPKFQTRDRFVGGFAPEGEGCAFYVVKCAASLLARVNPSSRRRIHGVFKGNIAPTATAVKKP